MIDPFSPHTGVRTIQNTGVFWQAVFQRPRPHSLFLNHGSAVKTLIKTTKKKIKTLIKRRLWHLCHKLVNLVSSRRTEIFVRASVYWETDVHNRARSTKRTVARPGFEMYPSNMPRMPNKDLPRFLQSLSRAHQNRGHERKALLSHQDVKLSFVSIRWTIKAQKTLSNSAHLHVSIWDLENTVWYLFVCFRKDPVF